MRALGFEVKNEELKKTVSDVDNCTIVALSSLSLRGVDRLHHNTRVGPFMVHTKDRTPLVISPPIWASW
jgi:hypothetical protein